MRAHVFRSEGTRAAAARNFPAAIEWPPVGLPKDYLALLAPGPGGFRVRGETCRWTRRHRHGRGHRSLRQDSADGPMNQSSRIGIDRRLNLEWLDAVAARVAAGDDESSIRAHLFEALRGEVRGSRKRGTALHKTVGVLVGAWVLLPEELLSFRDRAIDLLPSLSPSERLAMHWAVLMASYRFPRRRGVEHGAPAVASGQRDPVPTHAPDATRLGRPFDRRPRCPAHRPFHGAVGHAQRLRRTRRVRPSLRASQSGPPAQRSFCSRVSCCTCVARSRSSRPFDIPRCSRSTLPFAPTICAGPLCSSFTGWAWMWM